MSKYDCNKRWRNSKRGKILYKIAAKRYRERVKELVWDHYGRICTCCGETEIKFLTLDHIKGGGSKHRKQIRLWGSAWYDWVKKYKPKYLQVLCFNCNCGKSRNNGICPHKT